jgi:LysM repeat protein/lysophospholipase L1-like esterase
MFNNHLKLFLIILYSFLVGHNLIGQTDENLEKKLSIKPSYNYIQFNNPSLFQELLVGLQSAKNKGFSIVHFGDSHIQAEGPTSVARKNLHAKYGDAGRGMMFAYSAANSYTSIQYGTSHTGNWTYAKSFQASPKLPIGVSGMTVNTTEKDASLIFKLKYPSPNYTKLKLFIAKDSTCFDFKLIANSDTFLIKTNEYLSHSKPFIELTIPSNTSTISIKTWQNKPFQNHFEFYGMSFETPTFNGVIYHSVGVGASQFGSLLVEQLLEPQLQALSPNLLVLDFGTNNYLYDNQVKPELGPQIEQIIQNLKKYAPKAIILLTSTQDLYFKSKPVTAGIIFRNLIDSLAKKNNCLFWDWYAVAGGKKSLTKWRDAGYAQNDLVHLTNKGYEFKGQLFYEAIENSIDSLKKNPNLLNIILPYEEGKDVTLITNEKEEVKSSDKKEVVHKPIKNDSNVKPPVKKKEDEKKTPPKTKTHIVKKGDTLYDLAKKYKTTVAQIKKTNNLKSDNLKIGQKLIIP